MLSRMQREYRRNATRRWNVKTGATRSGKTYGDYFIIPKRIMAGSGKPGLNVILGNTKGTLQRNIIQPLQDLYGPSLVSDIRSDNTATLFGETAYCLGADNVRHVNRLRGSSIKYCYGDEVTTWHQDVFDMLKSRLDKPYSLFDGTCNPAHPTHWFKLFLDGNADIYQQAYTIDDNPFLAHEFVANLKQEYTGTVYYDRYIRGLWVAAEGAIYRQFCDNPDRYITDRPPQIMRAVIGVDFGGGTSAHAFCCLGFTAGMRDLVVLDELREQDALTPDVLEQRFVDFVRRCQMRWLVTDAYCDNAEKTLIAGLRTAAAQARLPLNIGNAIKRPINDRIRALCILMGADRFRVVRSCTATIDALRSAVWDAKKPVADVRLDDGTTNIDSLDALEYAYERDIETLVSMWRQT